MQTVGVICEYNPFHLGHARQLAMIRQQLGGDAAVLCLMSGNYVQRGEPAVFDKGVRARAAVDAGRILCWSCRSRRRCSRPRASPPGACRSYPRLAAGI